MGTLVAAQAVPSGEDGDAREAAGFSDGRPESAIGAVRICAAPRPWVQALHVTVCTALTTAGCSAGTLTVPSETQNEDNEYLSRNRGKEEV